MTALLFGIGAALGWGTADYLAALATRRVGTFRTTFGMQASSLVIFGALGAATGELPPFTRGPLGMVLVLRAGTTFYLALFGLARFRGRPLRPLRASLAPIVLIGILDTTANLAFGLGAIAGYAAIVATGASSYPLIPFALGLGV